MRWEKKGLIFKAENQFPWMAHHASAPIPYKISDEVVRIYFTSRDQNNRSYVTFIEVEADHPSHVMYLHDRPLLSASSQRSVL